MDFKTVAFDRSEKQFIRRGKIESTNKEDSKALTTDAEDIFGGGDVEEVVHPPPPCSGVFHPQEARG